MTAFLSCALIINEKEKNRELIQSLDKVNFYGCYKETLRDGYEWPVDQYSTYILPGGYYNDIRYVYNYRKKRWEYVQHGAIDIAGKHGEHWIHSMEHGQVESVKYDKWFGWQVKVINQDSYIIYSHLEDVKVKPMDWVTTETVIAKMGNSGLLSKGKHLHVSCYELIDGKYQVVNLLE
jgi:murein DD-endopeptidase MepM/ murein hydrolase activator NlpD